MGVLYLPAFADLTIQMSLLHSAEVAIVCPLLCGFPVPRPVAPSPKPDPLSSITDTKAPSQPEPWELAAPCVTLGEENDDQGTIWGYTPLTITIDPNFQ